MDMLNRNPNQPRQEFSTKGLAEMSRPGLLARFFMGVVKGAESLNLRHAVHGNPPVYQATDFSWVPEIEKAYPDIRAELERVLLRKSELPNFQDISSDVKSITSDAGWKTFFLVGFGKPSARNTNCAPKPGTRCGKSPDSRRRCSRSSSRESTCPPTADPTTACCVCTSASSFRTPAS